MLFLLKKKDFDKVRELITTHGADINYMNGEALREAVNNNQLNTVHFLIKNGADVNAALVDETPLKLAVINDNVAIATLLLRNGAENIYGKDILPWLKARP